MSEKLPVVSGKDVIKVLTKNGFVVKRVTGSHYILLNLETRKIVPVPYHKSLKKGVLLSIIEQSGMKKEEFIALL